MMAGSGAPCLAPDYVPGRAIPLVASLHHGKLRVAMGPERTVIGVDIGGTKIAAALLRGRPPQADSGMPAARETPEVLDRFTVPTDVGSTQACLDGIVACIADLEHGSGRVEGIGVGVASMVDFAAGHVVESVNLPLVDVPLRDLLQRRFGVPVVRRQRRQRGGHRRARLRRRRRRARDAHAHAGHGRGGRHHLRRPPVSRLQRSRRRARPHHHRRQRAQVPGQLPQPRLSRGVRGRPGDDRGGRGRRGGRAGLGSRPRPGGRRAGRQPAADSAGPGGRRPAPWPCSPVWASISAPAS